MQFLTRTTVRAAPFALSKRELLIESRHTAERTRSRIRCFSRRRRQRCFVRGAERDGAGGARGGGGMRAPGVSRRQ